MFKVGQKLKANMAVAEYEYGQWKGSQVYTAMMKAAEEKRFEVTGDSGGDYLIKRLEDNEIQSISKTEAQRIFVTAED